MSGKRESGHSQRHAGNPYNCLRKASQAWQNDEEYVATIIGSEKHIKSFSG